MVQKEYRTKSRKDMIEYMELQKDKRFCALDVYSYLEENGKKVNLATIYRNLEKMTETGLLLKYKSPEDGSCMYQYVATQNTCHTHLHMHCGKCGKIVHLECDFMEEIRKHIKEHHGFYLECQNSTLNGLCKECHSLMQ